MGNTPDPATSLTLLRALCGPEKDEAAWRAFCERYEPQIRQWCDRQGLQKADSDDVTQTVLTRMFTKIKSYDPDRGRFRSWLKTVVDNAVKDLLRRRGRRPGDQGSGDSDVGKLLQAIADPGTVDSLVQELDTSLLRDLGAELVQLEKEFGPDTIRAFRMTVMDGISIKDAAAQLGKSYGAVCMAAGRVKNRLRAAFPQLQQQAENESGDPP